MPLALGIAGAAFIALAWAVYPLAIAALAGLRSRPAPSRSVPALSVTCILAARETERFLRPESGAEGARVRRPAGVDVLVAPEHARRIMAARIGGEAALRKRLRRRLRTDFANIVRIDLANVPDRGSV